ncbi:MAG: branched-chain amino acid ABC transporter permease [Xanthobacteraceae bacterium]|nr:MAG: branched-chain amino acid ABC transporter permease [Xanthobacteraceae bacterium]
MDALLFQITSGITTGFIYASLALALVMIFQSTNHINFAQGEMAMFSTYIAFTLVQAGVPFWIAFPTTLLGAFVMGFVIERFVLRPFADAPVLTIVIVFIGLLVIFNSIAGWIFGYEMQPFPSPFPHSWGTRLVSAHQLGIAVVTLSVLAAVYLFFRFTSLGLAMRAAAQNPVSSRLVGIRVGLLLAVGWGLAAAIGAVAGIMAAPIVFLEPNMMAGIMIYAFAAALLGGINNPAGAVPGGIIVGVLENLAGAYVVGTELKLTTALVMILLVLLIRPAGLFGRTLRTRV